MPTYGYSQEDLRRWVETGIDPHAAKEGPLLLNERRWAMIAPISKTGGRKKATWREVDGFLAEAVDFLYQRWHELGGPEPRPGDEKYLRDALEVYFCTADMLEAPRR